MIKSIRYCVAGHRFDVWAESLDAVRSCLSSYEPFRMENSEEDEVLFSVYICREVLVEGDVLDTFEWEDATCVVHRCSDGAWGMELSPTGLERKYAMKMSSNFRTICVAMHDEMADVFVLNYFLMMSFVCATAPLHTLMMHASVVMKQGYGYLFLGKSGTGKSTHSQLWLQNIAGVELLNDDNPVIRIIEGKPWVYGSPWSGKTACYRNESVRVGAFVRLYQAPVNRIEQLSVVKGLAALTGSSSLIRWDEQLGKYAFDTLAELLSEVPVFRLECLPDYEAALLSYKTVDVWSVQANG